MALHVSHAQFCSYLTLIFNYLKRTGTDCSLKGKLPSPPGFCVYLPTFPGSRWLTPKYHVCYFIINSSTFHKHSALKKIDLELFEICLQHLHIKGILTECHKISLGRPFHNLEMAAVKGVLLSFDYLTLHVEAERSRP